VAGREDPTNERVVALLREILRELKALAARQERVEANLAKLTRTTR
jgi:hypothetical protein